MLLIGGLVRAESKEDGSRCGVCEGIVELDDPSLTDPIRALSPA